MEWWEAPNDVCFLNEYSAKMKGYKASDLMGIHVPQPNDPWDFSSGPKFVIHDYTVKPDGDVMTFKDGIFTIGNMRYRSVEGWDQGLEPLHLYEISE